MKLLASLLMAAVLAAPAFPAFSAGAAAPAKADLAKQGITNPTNAQLGAATSNVQGLRDSGMGWGAIANSLGLRLGDVVSDANQAKQAVLARDAAAARVRVAQSQLSETQARNRRLDIRAPAAGQWALLFTHDRDGKNLQSISMKLR